MRYSAVDRHGAGAASPRVEELVMHVGRLLRHPAYRRERVVSPMLLRHLPMDAGYAWRGEDGLRNRLVGIGLDGPSLEHLIANVRAELARLRAPNDA